MDAFHNFAKVRVAGSNPVVRSIQESPRSGRASKAESPSSWCRSVVVARSLLAPRRSEPTGITGYERITVGARGAGSERSSYRSISRA